MLISGVIATELWRNMKDWGLLTRLVMIPVEYVMKTPFNGAQTTLYCAINSAVEKDTGLYYSDCAEKLPSIDPGLIDEHQKRLWTISEKAVGLNPQHDEGSNEDSSVQESGC
jgi:retinol dehydrogenase-13